MFFHVVLSGVVLWAGLHALKCPSMPCTFVYHECIHGHLQCRWSGHMWTLPVQPGMRRQEARQDLAQPRLQSGQLVKGNDLLACCTCT